MLQPLLIGLIGLGRQVRDFHLPYLETRARELKDLQVAWISGYVEEDESIAQAYQSRYKCAHGEGWKQLLIEQPVDGVIVSLPNALHADPIREALRLGVNVAVEKPPTITAASARDLVRQALEADLVFVTISQRRYEKVYQLAREITARGDLGSPRYISYLISHSVAGRGENGWPSSRRLSGGGALISSGYHGLDTILWLLSQAPTPPPPPRSVSARWILDNRFPPSGPEDRTESVAVVRVTLGEGYETAIFQLTASFECPEGSLDENIKIYGSQGAIRIMRDFTRKTGMQAPAVTFQRVDGTAWSYDTSGWSGERSAPVEDFINAVAARKRGAAWKVLSPTADCLTVMEIIEKAYESAAQGGGEILL